MSDKCYLVHYTKDGSYINIQVYAETEDEAISKADDKFYTKYNADANAGFVFDFVDEIKPLDDETAMLTLMLFDAGGF